MGRIHQPRKGNLIWDGSLPIPERNGTIVRVIYDDREVIVKFAGTGHLKPYTWDELDGNWHERLGYILNREQADLT